MVLKGTRMKMQVINSEAAVSSKSLLKNRDRYNKCEKHAFIHFVARCPIATVTRVREEGKYFYAAQSELRALFDFDGWDGTTMDVVQERKLGTDINGQEQLQTWTGTIRAWDRGDDSHGRREPSTLAAAGQWKVGDKIKSKDCHPPPASDLCKSSAGGMNIKLLFIIFKKLRV